MPSVPLKLLHDYVLVRRIPMPETTQSGLYLPLKAVEVPQLGHIVCIGPKNPESLRPGALVLMRKFEGHRLEFLGEIFHLLKVYDILAEIKE